MLLCELRFALFIITLIGEAARSEALFLALFIIMPLPRGYPKQTFKAAVSVLAAVVISAMAALFLQALVADLSWARVLMIAASTFFAMLIGRKLNQPLAGALMSVLLTEPLLIYDSYSNPEHGRRGSFMVRPDACFRPRHCNELSSTCSRTQPPFKDSLTKLPSI